jgi:hypothetical protein
MSTELAECALNTRQLWPLLLPVDDEPALSSPPPGDGAQRAVLWITGATLRARDVRCGQLRDAFLPFFCECLVQWRRMNRVADLHLRLETVLAAAAECAAPGGLPVASRRRYMDRRREGHRQPVGRHLHHSLTQHALQPHAERRERHHAARREPEPLAQRGLVVRVQ